MEGSHFGVTATGELLEADYSTKDFLRSYAVCIQVNGQPRASAHRSQISHSELYSKSFYQTTFKTSTVSRIVEMVDHDQLKWRNLLLSIQNLSIHPLMVDRGNID